MTTDLNLSTPLDFKPKLKSTKLKLTLAYLKIHSSIHFTNNKCPTLFPNLGIKCSSWKLHPPSPKKISLPNHPPFSFLPKWIPRFPPPPPQMSSTPPTTTTTTNYLTNLGLGYSIAIALGFLVLLSTVLLASYICCRCRHHQHHSNPTTITTTTSDGIMLPRIIFVAEDEDQDPNGDENIVVGLDQAVINSYPKFQFTKDNSSVSNTTCSICLCEYKDFEMLRMMPECRHYFHLCCIDAWLKLNGSCPVCRNSPLPTPLSTPLSEVVPLSQYAADRRRRR